MNITVNAKYITLTDAIRDYSEKKIQRIAKYFDDKMDIHVNLNVEKNMHIAEIFVNVKGMFLKGIEKSEDMYASIDMVEETIERQLVKYKNKLIDKKKSYRYGICEWRHVISDVLFCRFSLCFCGMFAII